MARPEPMNATTAHSKAKLSLSFSDRLYVAGEHVTGKIELECKAERGLGIADIKVELFAFQELTSRDHSATNTFLHLTRYFQGEGLPPSNAVHAHPLSETDEALLAGYYEARKGRTTFFFRFPLPPSSPASIDFNKGLAKLKYEVRASAGISWRSEMQRVTERKEIMVVELPVSNVDAEQVVVAENGKFWVQGRLLGPYVIAGRTSCLELFVKNHSLKSTTSLTLTLSRHLQVPALSQPNKSLDVSDTFFEISFEGPDYIVNPGMEGTANLVFEVPRWALGVRAGKLDPGEESSQREEESIFGLQLVLEAKIGMGPGNKDVVLSMPICIAHPASLRALPSSPTYGLEFSPPMSYGAMSPDITSPYQVSIGGLPGYMSPPLSPPLTQPIWPPPAIDQYAYYPPPPNAYQVRSASADPYVAQQLPIMPMPPLLNPYDYEADTNPHTPDHATPEQVNAEEGEPGKGERASRISAHLRMSSRNRSVSPQSHRFPQPPLIALDTSPVTPCTIPAGPPVQGSPLTVVTTHLNASPKTDAQVHSPRPILSPKHSFSIDRGTVKSEHVADLERMAAEEVGSEKAKRVNEINKTLPAPPPISKLSTSTGDPLQLPPQPVLHPVANQRQRLPSSWKKGAGLDALEQKLLEQVGTRKPDPIPHPDVRIILPAPINIPSLNHKANPLNDSAISSLSLDQEVQSEHLELPDESNGDILTVEDLMPSKSNEDHRRTGQDRTKRSNKGHLKKAATGRVAQWLGSIEVAGVEEAVDLTPSDSGPRAVSNDLPESKDIDPHPLLRSPLDTNEEVVPMPQMEAIPTTSSGFASHPVGDSTSAPGDVSKPSLQKGSDPSPITQSGPSINNVTVSAPLKPVLKHFALPRKGDLTEAKYDIRSARGGRGGKVTSVSAMWASLAAQEEAKPASNPQGKKGDFNPVFRQPRPKAAFSPKHYPSGEPRSGGQRKLQDVGANNVGDLSTRRARMIKSTSVPAAVSSSLATPVLSSTASLARPMQAHSHAQGPAHSNKNHVYPRMTPTSVRSPDSGKTSEEITPPVKSQPLGDLGFGQARLKDLIRKYQQGFAS